MEELESGPHEEGQPAKRGVDAQRFDAIELGRAAAWNQPVHHTSPLQGDGKNDKTSTTITTRDMKSAGYLEEPDHEPYGKGVAGGVDGYRVAIAVLADGCYAAYNHHPEEKQR